MLDTRPRVERGQPVPGLWAPARGFKPPWPAPTCRLSGSSRDALRSVQAIDLLLRHKLVEGKRCTRKNGTRDRFRRLNRTRAVPRGGLFVGLVEGPALSLERPSLGYRNPVESSGSLVATKPVPSRSKFVWRS